MLKFLITSHDVSLCGMFTSISLLLLDTVVTLPTDVNINPGGELCDVSSAPSQLTQLHDERTGRHYTEFPHLVDEVTPKHHLDPEFFHPTFEHPFCSDLLIAAPENLNPGLAIPPSLSDTLGPAQDLENVPLEDIDGNEEKNGEDENREPIFSIENLNLNYRTDSDNFGGWRQTIEPTVTLQLANGDELSMTTGFNTFDQVDIARVTNVPLDITWHHDIDNSSIELSAGIDWFNRLPISPRLGFEGTTPLFEGATLSGVIEYQPYKFNAQTLENQIKALRFGPNFFWQINSDIYLFSLLRLGTYNDGNTEQQSFSRLEYRSGNFGIATNLFNWVYRANLENQSGYFSPPDFLVYNGEVFWEDDIINGISCRITASLGRQRLDGLWTSAYSYGPTCQANIADNIQFNLGYDFSNVRDQTTGGSAFNNRTITGAIEVGF